MPIHAKRPHEWGTRHVLGEGDLFTELSRPMTMVAMWMKKSRQVLAA
jgi:hypothetical protein